MFCLKFFLIPFAWLYGLILWIRNLYYDYQEKLTTPQHRPGRKIHVISVGNLAMGGTGKTPFVSYLAHYFVTRQRPIVILSKGYKRHTKGYREAGPLDTASTIGDECYQLYHYFSKHNLPISIIIANNRKKALSHIAKKYPAVEIALLDDGFQHRCLKRDIDLLLTSFYAPFHQDHLFPVGSLREPRQGALRADMLIVTNTPPHLSPEELCDWQKKIRYQGSYTLTQPCFFTTVQYQEPISIWPEKNFDFSTNVLLVTGIAAPEPFLVYTKARYVVHDVIRLPDHHWFTRSDFKKIATRFSKVQIKEKCILTTEKDAARFQDPLIACLFNILPIFYLPIHMVFLDKAQENQFLKAITPNYGKSSVLA